MTTKLKIIDFEFNDLKSGKGKKPQTMAIITMFIW